MKKNKNSTVQSRKRVLKKAAKTSTKKRVKTPKKTTKKPFDWNSMAGIGLRGGKVKPVTKPEKDIVWGD